MKFFQGKPDSLSPSFPALSRRDKSYGVKACTGLIKAQLLKIPKSVLKKVSKQIGIKLTKSSLKAFVESGKLIPVVGSVIGGGWNYFESSVVAKRAWREIIENDPRFARVIHLIT